MIRKIFPALLILTIVGVLSCDNETINPEKEAVAPPPAVRTISVYGRMGGATSQTADVYYSTASIGWTYLATLSETNCQQLTSFSANDSDVLYFVMVTGSSAASFKARTSGSCATNLDNTYCDYPSGGTTGFSFTVSGDTSVGLRPDVISGNILVCV